METVYYNSPIGVLCIAGKEGMVFSVNVVEVVPLKKDMSKTPAYLNETVKQLDAYFKGTLRQFDLPLYAHAASSFTQEVRNTLQTIPFGHTLRYGDIAKKVNNPNASRAVGNVCNRNAILLIIPCHRVVAGNQKSGGFALGKEKKAWLLAHEQRYS